MKIIPVGAGLYHAGIANAPNKHGTNLNVVLSPASVSRSDIHNSRSRDLEKLLVLQPVKTLLVSNGW
jgi:hypothetical protein